jgi:hypothetical protein
MYDYLAQRSGDGDIKSRMAEREHNMRRETQDYEYPHTESTLLHHRSSIPLSPF